MPQMKKYFTFEVQVLDDQNVRRRFRASNYQVSLGTQALNFELMYHLIAANSNYRRSLS